MKDRVFARKDDWALASDGLHKALEYDPATGQFTWRWRFDAPPAWNARFAGQPAGTLDRYVQILLSGKLYYAHRLAWLFVYGEWPHGEIDHINRDKTDNRIANLRLATKSQNQMNVGLRSDNSSKVKGVHWYKRSGKWHAQIKVNHHQLHIGYFDLKSDAIAARRDAEAKHFGEWRHA